jgi:hypothetical protein
MQSKRVLWGRPGAADTVRNDKMRKYLCINMLSKRESFPSHIAKLIMRPVKKDALMSLGRPAINYFQIAADFRYE